MISQTYPIAVAKTHSAHLFIPPGKPNLQLTPLGIDGRIYMTFGWKLAAFFVCLMLLLSCSGKRPTHLGVTENRLAPCPSSRNCVSSDAVDTAHRVKAFALLDSPIEPWHVIREEVAALPRTTVVKETENYLHAQCVSALFGFVDDLELYLRESDDIVSIRSASRVGYFDFGVNRRRVERLRKALRARGVVQ